MEIYRKIREKSPYNILKTVNQIGLLFGCEKLWKVRKEWTKKTKICYIIYKSSDNDITNFRQAYENKILIETVLYKVCEIKRSR